MAEQVGIVIGTESGGWARVLSDRHGACGGCHTSHGGGCQSCLAGSKFESRVTNPLGAQPGDVVKISIRSQDLFKGAAVLYLLPIAVLIIGALAGAWGGERIGWQETTGAIIGSAFGIAVAAYLLIRLGRSQWAQQRLTPTVIEVLSSEKNKR